VRKWRADHQKGEEASQAGAVIVPKSTKRPPEPVKRCLSHLASLSGSVAFEAQEGCDEFLTDGVEQGKEEGIDQHDHAKQLEAGFS